MPLLQFVWVKASCSVPNYVGLFSDWGAGSVSDTEEHHSSNSPILGSSNSTFALGNVQRVPLQ